MFVNCSGDEIVEPLFPCSEKLDNPYGATVHFAHKSRDFDSESEQLQMLKDMSVSNIRFDFWIPYKKKLLSSKNVPIIGEAEKKVHDAGLSTLGILFLGWKKQHAWENVELYKEYLEYLMSEYGDIVAYWEVFNEIDMLKKKESYSVQEIANDYMKVLPYTYKKIKERNPNAVVTSCSFSNMRTGLLELLSEMDAHNFFDVLNYHSYEFPEALPNEFKKIRSIMDHYGWRKPVWLTEYGFSTYVDSSKQFDKENVQKKEDVQAKRLPRAFIISLAYGFDKVFFYNFRARENSYFDKEENFGIVHKDLSEKKAYRTLTTLIKMLPNGSSRPTLIVKKNVYESEWRRPDGKRIRAYWKNKGEEDYFVKLQQDDEVYNCYGDRVLDVPRFSLDGCVLYLVSAK